MQCNDASHFASRALHISLLRSTAVHDTVHAQTTPRSRRLRHSHPCRGRHGASRWLTKVRLVLRLSAPVTARRGASRATLLARAAGSRPSAPPMTAERGLKRNARQPKGVLRSSEGRHFAARCARLRALACVLEASAPCAPPRQHIPHTPRQHMPHTSLHISLVRQHTPAHASTCLTYVRDWLGCFSPSHASVAFQVAAPGLTAAQLEAFRRDGVLVIEGFSSERELGAIKAAVEERVERDFDPEQVRGTHLTRADTCAEARASLGLRGVF